MQQDRLPRGFVVVRPRPADAIGDALRGVFERKDTLPCDMSSLLDQLDRVDERRHP